MNSAHHSKIQFLIIMFIIFVNKLPFRLSIIPNCTLGLEVLRTLPGSSTPARAGYVMHQYQAVGNVSHITFAIFIVDIIQDQRKRGLDN